MNELSPVRFGVIGVGIIGRQHVARLLSDASPAALIALADANAEAAQTVAEENGVEAAASVEELLAREDIDAVVIAVPSGLHADVTIEALDAGKHVFLEKPIEVTVEASDRIRAAEQRSGTILSISSQRRFAAENQYLKKIVSEGKLGRITSATVEVPLWRTQEYYDSGAWRGTWKLDGGGALMNQGVHLVDLTLWLLGEVEELYAYTGLLAHERIEVEDTVTAAARLRSGTQLDAPGHHRRLRQPPDPHELDGRRRVDRDRVRARDPFPLARRTGTAGVRDCRHHARATPRLRRRRSARPHSPGHLGRSPCGGGLHRSRVRIRADRSAGSSRRDASLRLRPVGMEAVVGSGVANVDAEQTRLAR